MEDKEAEHLLQISKDSLSTPTEPGSLELSDASEEDLILTEYESDEEQKIGNRYEYWNDYKSLKRGTKFSREICISLASFLERFG